MKSLKHWDQTSSRNTISRRLSVLIETRQRRLADFLNNRTSGMSRHNLFFALVIFCGSFGGYLLYLLLTCFDVIN